MFQVNYCEYNRSNADCDRIYRPGGSGDYLLLLLKTPMKCRLKGKLEISGGSTGLSGCPEVPEQLCAFFNGSSSHGKLRDPDLCPVLSGKFFEAG